MDMELRLARLEAENDDLRARIRAIEVLMVGIVDGAIADKGKLDTAVRIVLDGATDERAMERYRRLIALREASQGNIALQDGAGR